MDLQGDLAHKNSQAWEGILYLFSFYLLFYSDHNCLNLKILHQKTLLILKENNILLNG